MGIIGLEKKFQWSMVIDQNQKKLKQTISLMDGMQENIKYLKNN